MIVLWIYFFVVALYNPEFRGLNLSNYLLVIGLLIVLLTKNKEFRIFNSSRKIIPIIGVGLLFAYLFLHTVMFSDNISVSIIVVLKFSIPIIFCLLLLNTVKKHKQFIKLINIITYSGILAACYGCIQYYFKLSDYILMNVNGAVIYRAIGAFKQANVFASYLILIVPFIVYKIRNSESRHMKIFSISSLFVVLTAIYLTYSRWAIISLIFVYLVYFIKKLIRNLLNKGIRITKKGYIKICLALLALPGFTIVFWQIFNTYSKKIYSLFFNRNSNNVRINNIAYAFGDFKIFGHGLGNGNVGTIIDSTYLNILFDLGLIGMIVTAFIFIYMYIKANNRAKPNYSLKNIYVALELSLFLFMVNGSLESILYNSVINGFMGMYLFVIYAKKSVVSYDNVTLTLSRFKICNRIIKGYLHQ